MLRLMDMSVPSLHTESVIECWYDWPSSSCLGFDVCTVSANYIFVHYFYRTVDLFFATTTIFANITIFCCQSSIIIYYFC